MITTVMTLGKYNIYLSCGHRIRGDKKNPMSPKIGQLFNCFQCDRNKPLHGKPLKETATYKAKQELKND